MFKLSPRTILCYLWVALLAFSFYVSVRSSYREALSTEEFAYACDPFGYLQMAKQIRYAASRDTWPEYKLESPQTRLLINFLQQQNLPAPRWEDVVGPHAHHYFPRAGYVGVQYPPGTGLVLAMFPQGEAVYDLNRLVVVVFVVVGIAALLFAAWRQAWASIGLVVLALILGLMMLARVGFLSFSINAVLVPVLLTCLLSMFALWSKTANRERLALLCALLAGTSLGFATLIRLPSFLLLPGFLVLLWPGFRGVRVKSLPVGFSLGLVVTGIIPVLIHQQAVAGAWYLSTYISVDAAAPAFDGLRSNFAYFLKDGPGSIDNWSLVYALVGFAGFVMLRPSSSNRLGLSWKRLALAAFLIWFISICYFLTHQVTAPHYMIPAVFAAVALIGFGALGIEATSTAVKPFDRRRVVSWVALALILWPGLATFKRVWSARFTGPVPVRASTHAPVLLPSELVDDKAWVWADLLTGSLWYYANKPAFKIDKTDEEVRAMMFRWVFERGERQYLIQDSEQMKKYMAEIQQLGGKLEPRGKVDGQPYFLVVWPGTGPSVPTHFTD